MALSDGVFAIAMTLLVLDISVPPGLDGQRFREALGDLPPKIAAYALSFLIIGAFWLDHRRAFLGLRRVDRAFTAVALTGLGLTAFLPFPTSLLSEYGGMSASVAIYAATIAAMDITQIMLVRLRMLRPRLDAVPLPRPWHARGSSTWRPRSWSLRYPSRWPGRGAARPCGCGCCCSRSRPPPAGREARRPVRPRQAESPRTDHLPPHRRRAERTRATAGGDGCSESGLAGCRASARWAAAQATNNKRQTSTRQPEATVHGTRPGSARRSARCRVRCCDGCGRRCTRTPSCRRAPRPGARPAHRRAHTSHERGLHPAGSGVVRASCHSLAVLGKTLSSRIRMIR
ncbi:TMEM175 family protein [Yinghuangia aomiensis]